MDMNNEPLNEVQNSHFEISIGSVTDSTTPDSKAGPSTPKSTDLTNPGEFKVFLPPQVSFPKKPDDVPDDFFTPTTDDLRAVQSSLSARVRNMRDAPLLTEKLRMEREKERLSRWPTATIRVKFADRTMLEKVFPSSDKIKSVYAFIRSSLREDVRPHKFVLYDTPPRRELKVSDPTVRDKSLFELQLAPQSVLLFQFLEEELDLDTPTRPPPLLPAILTMAVPLSPQLNDSAESGPTKRKTPIKPPTASGSVTSDKKIPKWLKHGKK